MKRFIFSMKNNQMHLIDNQMVLFLQNNPQNI